MSPLLWIPAILIGLNLGKVFGACSGQVCSPYGDLQAFDDIDFEDFGTLLLQTKLQYHAKQQGDVCAGASWCTYIPSSACASVPDCKLSLVSLSVSIASNDIPGSCGGSSWCGYLPRVACTLSSTCSWSPGSNKSQEVDTPSSTDSPSAASGTCRGSTWCQYLAKSVCFSALSCSWSLLEYEATSMVEERFGSLLACTGSTGCQYLAKISCQNAAPTCSWAPLPETRQISLLGAIGQSSTESCTGLPSWCAFLVKEACSATPDCKWSTLSFSQAQAVSSKDSADFGGVCDGDSEGWCQYLSRAECYYYTECNWRVLRSDEVSALVTAATFHENGAQACKGDSWCSYLPQASCAMVQGCQWGEVTKAQAESLAQASDERVTAICHGYGDWCKYLPQDACVHVKDCQYSLLATKQASTRALSVQRAGQQAFCAGASSWCEYLPDVACYIAPGCTWSWSPNASSPPSTSTSAEPVVEGRCVGGIGSWCRFLSAVACDFTSLCTWQPSPGASTTKSLSTTVSTSSSNASTRLAANVTHQN